MYYLTTCVSRKTISSINRHLVFISSSFFQYRKLCSKSQPNGVKEYLRRFGYDDNTISSIMKAFPQQKPSISDLKALGATGLKELVKAIDHENKKIKNTDQIFVNITIPKNKVIIILMERNDFKLLYFK